MTSPYEKRPWLSLYSMGVPHDLPLPTISAIGQFRDTAQRVPDSPAIYYFDTIISFGKVDQLSNNLAVALQALGVKKGDRVALYLQNVPQFWVAQLAVWKIGAIVVPQNPMYKVTELQYNLNDSGASVLIALESLYETVAKNIVKQTKVNHVITTSEIDFFHNDERPALFSASQKQRYDDTLDLLELCERYNYAPDPDVPVQPEDIAYLTYTSGTTGPPKGAINTHANVAFNAEVYRTWVKLGPGDVVIGAAPLFHITGMIAHLAVAALAGVPVILAYRFDAAEILRLIECWKGSFTVASITAYIALMNHPDIHKRDLSSFRKAYSGGAPIPPAITEQFKATAGVYIHNVYGLTETNSPSHAVPFGADAPVDAESGALSVGVPIPNSIIKIADLDTGEDLPVGQVGEIVTKGPMVVPGYWQKPDETANAIREGWLYTGDVGRMDENGWFYLVDRKKDMIVASGFKVWPREVEDVLYQHEAVKEASVVGVPDPYRGETVKAFIALKDGFEGKVDPKILIDFCKDRLATYKSPRDIEFIQEVPKTATGKFLRRDLRERSK